MKKLYLARHGQTQLNAKGLVQGQSDSPLTEKGKEQALALRSLLTNLNANLDASVSSDLGRAIETMQIASTTPLMLAHAGLREISFGDLEKTDGSLINNETWNEDYKKYHGESVDDCIRRVYRTLLEIVKYPAWNNVLVISHGVPVSMMYQLLAKNPKKEWNEFELITNGTLLEYSFEEGRGFQLENIYRTEEPESFYDEEFEEQEDQIVQNDPKDQEDQNQ